MNRRRGAAAGVLAAGLGITVAELLAAVTRPAAAPLVAVGGAIIDATPTPLKEFAVRELGTADKPALLAGIAVVLAAFAALTGVLATRHRRAALAGPAVLGAAGVLAALSRPAGTWFDVVAVLVAVAVAAVALRVLLAAAAPAPDGSVRGGRQPFATPAPGGRRAFVIAAGAAAVSGAAAGLVGRVRGGRADRDRRALRLPAPQSPAPPVVPSSVTANAEFYRVDTALAVPRIDPGTWSLRIHGRVGRELRLSLADLLERPLVERYVTLTCVSNEVGGPYAGTARWLGVPLAPLLREAGLDPAADQLVARSSEGMTIGTPLAVVLDGRDAMLAVGMNGEPLPIEHGFPVRMLTPGLYGYAGACKWLSELEVTTFAAFDAYWVKRGWGRTGTVKTASRIDRPLPFAHPAAGPYTIAGVAWAQRRGIRTVEVSVDGGAWRQAELLPVPSTDVWVQWRLSWRATPGPHSIAVRAIDGTGAVQPGERATPFPDGATGWHTITVTVES